MEKESEQLIPRYFIQDDTDEKLYFESGSKLLQFLQDNDPIEAGCDLMSVEQWKKIPEA